MEKGSLGQNIDGTGDWMLCWQWEFQKQYGCEGWTYYCYFDTEELAKGVLESYVKTGFPGTVSTVKKRTNGRDYLMK